MRAERINQDQIRFTLSEEDLASRDLDLDELSYGTDKTQALFHDMLREAQDQFGMDFSKIPVTIEAIPVSEHSLIVTITKVKGEEAAVFGGDDGSFLSMISNAALQGQNKEADPEAQVDETSARTSRGKEAKKNEADEVLVGLGRLPREQEGVIYQFHDLHSLMRASALVDPAMRLRNELYRVETGTYYLVCHFNRMDAEKRYVASMLSEYAEDWYFGELMENLVKEHCSTVMDSRALQHLSKVENASAGSADAENASV